MDNSQITFVNIIVVCSCLAVHYMRGLLSTG